MVKHGLLSTPYIVVQNLWLSGKVPPQPASKCSKESVKEES